MSEFRSATGEDVARAMVESERELVRAVAREAAMDAAWAAASSLAAASLGYWAEAKWQARRALRCGAAANRLLGLLV